VSEIEQTLGSLSMEAVTLLLTGNNSNAGKCSFYVTSHSIPWWLSAGRYTIL